MPQRDAPPATQCGLRHLIDRAARRLAAREDVRPVLNDLADAAYRQGSSDAVGALRTTAQVAEELGRTVQHVRLIARRKRLGVGLGRDHLFTPADVQAIAQELRPGSAASRRSTEL